MEQAPAGWKVGLVDGGGPWGTSGPFGGGPGGVDPKGGQPGPPHQGQGSFYSDSS